MSDNRPVGSAQNGALGSEWRTAPLWGIGLTKTVSGHTFFLHDGRARNIKEAILWHGGEAKAAQNAFAFHGQTRQGEAHRLCELAMKKRFGLLAALLALVTSFSAPSHLLCHQSSTMKLLRLALTTHIRPSYGLLATAASELEQGMHIILCTEPTPDKSQEYRPEI